MMAKQENKRRSGSRREREHAEMLEAALARPGIREVMDVYRGVAGEGSGTGRLPFGYESARARHNDKFLQGGLNQRVRQPGNANLE